MKKIELTESVFAALMCADHVLQRAMQTDEKPRIVGAAIEADTHCVPLLGKEMVRDVELELTIIYRSRIVKCGVRVRLHRKLKSHPWNVYDSVVRLTSDPRG